MVENPPELSNDVLCAYADNELPKDEMLRLALLIEADPEASKKVEDFRRSGEQIRELFSVDTPAETPPEIAQKIRAMSGADRLEENVVSLTSYRQRLSRGFKGLTSGAGLQKIAASLFIGVVVGIGVTSQFGDSKPTGLTVTSQLNVGGGPNQIEETSNEPPSLDQGHNPDAEPLSRRLLSIEEEPLPPQQPSAALFDKQDSLAVGPAQHLERLSVANSLNNLAMLYATDRSAVPLGSTVSTAERYRIEIGPLDAENASLIYHFKDQAPVTLIDRKLIVSGRTLKFPESAQKGIKFHTDAPFVTFELRLESQGRITRKYFVYGIE